MQKYLDLICSCSLFRDIPKNEISDAVKYLNAHIETFKKNETILSQGDNVEKAGILLFGRAEIRKNDYNGNSTLISELLSGQMFGEALCSTSAQKLPLSICCLEDCAVLFFDCKALLNVKITNKFQTVLMRNLLSEVSEKTLQLREKINIMCKKTTREKLMAYLLKQSERQGSNTFTIPLDRQSLADYLGVDRSAMSAEISKLVKDGVIKTQKSRFEILRDF